MARLLGTAHGPQSSLREMPSMLGFDEFLDFMELPEIQELEQRFAEE